MPCQVRTDTERSCFGGVPDQGWTLVASRLLTDEERKVFGECLDSTWYQTTMTYPGQPVVSDWHPIETMALLEEDERLAGIKWEIERAHSCNIHVANGVRKHVRQWIDEERSRYADVKFAEGAEGRVMLIQAIKDRDWERFTNFAGNYMRRAEIQGLDTPQGRQQMGKAIVTMLHMLETAILVYEPMPKPGVPSGEIHDWAETDFR